MICHCCEIDRVEADLPRRELKPLLRSTPIQHYAVALCDHCDGPAYQLGRRKEAKWFDPDILDD